MKVKIRFYCTKEKKEYKVGDEYTGKRKDLGKLLDAPKKEDKQHPKTKGKIATKKKK